MGAWVAEELAGVNLGDRRLNSRYHKVLGRLAERPGAAITVAFRGDAETQAAYRFFAHPNVTPQRLLASHFEATVRRVAAQPLVIVAQDTTEIDLTRPREKVGGPLNSESRYGLYIHPCLALTQDRVPLGLVHVEWIVRQPGGLGKRGECHKKPIEEKESFRWLACYRRCCELAAECPETRVVCVSDSEGDIGECLAEGVAGNHAVRAEWIIRACRDRLLSGEEPEKLFAAVRRQPVRDRFAVQVSARLQTKGDAGVRRRSREARPAQVAVRGAKLTLKLPGLTEPQTVHVVSIREDDPPEGVEPIDWTLLTSLPIETPEQMREVAEAYCRRWEIEIYFRTLKSGCRAEGTQLETTERVQAYLSAQLIVAWRVLLVTMTSREQPEASCELLFTAAEWRSAWVAVKQTPPPKQPPRLGEFVRLLAKLGGYLGRKNDPPPGPKALWLALQRLHDLASLWQLLHNAHHVV